MSGDAVGGRAAGGRVLSHRDHRHGNDPVTLTASDLNGWRISRWDGACTGTGSTCTLDSTKGSQSVTAYFADVGAPSVGWSVAPPSAGSHVRALTLSVTDGDNDKVQSLRFYSTQNGVTNVYDGTTLTDPGGTATHAFSFAGLSDGTYSFGAEARDYAGNITRAAVSLVLDRTVNAPQVDATPAWTTQTSPTITWSTLDADASASCRVGTAGSFTACTSGWKPTLAQGANTLTVRAADGAGNVADTTRTINVDSVAPTAGLGGAAITNAPSFVITADGTGSTATATCSVDGGTLAPCSGTFAPAGLADGPHTAHLHVVDQAGNTADADKAFTLDTVAPAASVDGGPADGAILNSAALAYAFNAEGGATLSCSLDSDSSFRPCSGTAQDALTGVGDGTRTWRLRAVDAAGNATMLARQFTVDTVAPTVSVTGGPPEGSTLEASTATFGFTPEAGSTVACALDSGSAFHPCTTSTTDAVSGLAVGPHVWRVRVTDAAGNSTVASRSFIVQQAPPPPNGRITSSVRYKWNVRGAKTRVLVLKTSKLPAGATVTVACKGKGRPFKARTFKPSSKGIVDLRAAFKKTLRPGVTVVIAMTKPGYAGKTFTFTTRKANTPRTKTAMKAGRRI